VVRCGVGQGGERNLRRRDGQRERCGQRDSGHHRTHDDDRLTPAHPPAAETEFRPQRPFPKRFANFGNEGENRAVSEAEPDSAVWPSRLIFPSSLRRQSPLPCSPDRQPFTAAVLRQKSAPPPARGA
jgi:hypothetical protein